MAVLSKGTTFGATEQVTSSKLNNLVDDGTFVTGGSGTCVSGGGIEVTSGGQLQIKDGDIATVKIANDAVDKTKIDFIADDLATTDTHILIADGTDFHNKAVSGDITITNAGVASVSASTDLPDGVDAVTQSASNNSTKVATTAYVDSQVNLAPSRVAVYTGSDISQTTSGDPTYTLTEVSDPSSIGTVSGSTVTVSAGYYSVAATFSLKNTTNSSGNYTGQIVTNINSAGESAQEFGQATPVTSSGSSSFQTREIKPVTIDASAGSTTIRLKFLKVNTATCQTEKTILYITKLT